MDDINLVRYKDWAPTGCDIKGLSLSEYQDWYVAPVSRSRGPRPLEESNFRVALKSYEELDKKGEDYFIARFNHWGPGWIEIILVRPDSEVAKEAQRDSDCLSQYACLSDSDYSELELEAKQSYWENCSIQKRIDLCNEAGVSIFASRRDSMPRDIGEHIYI